MKILRTVIGKIRKNKKLPRIFRLMFKAVSKLPKDKKLVIFESFHGKQYSDNPRAIFEYMSENNPDYKLYWSADRRHTRLFESRNVAYIRRFSVKWFFMMPRAKYWVINSRLPLWIPKPKHTKYVQTWHGTPLKKLGTDIEKVLMPGTNTEKYKKNFIFASSKWDYLISPNAYSTEIFRRAFGYNKQIIESGYPRNDFIVNANDDATIAGLKKQLNLPEEKKVILYAPTWRDNQFYSKGKYKFDLQMDLRKLYESLGDDYIILLRLHYLVAENIDLGSYEGFVFDVSNHTDIRELYLITDILITDYSSVFFDFANLKRPMLFFVYDIEDYRENLRGFYFDFDEQAPGPLVKTTDGIIKEILDIKRNGFVPSKATESFYERFCYLEDGHASKRVVESVFE